VPCAGRSSSRRVGAAIVTAGIAGFAAGGAVDGRRRVRLGQLALELASEVADALSRKGALKAHVRDELGLDEQRLARPFRAAWTLALSFTAGAALSLVAVTMLQQPLRIGGTHADRAWMARESRGAARRGSARFDPDRRVGRRRHGITAGIGVLVGTVA